MLPELSNAEAEHVVTTFLRQMLHRKGYNLEDEQGLSGPPACVPPAELQNTVVSSGMPKEWVHAIVQRAKQVAQVFLQSATNHEIVRADVTALGKTKAVASALPLMQADTVGVHIESYLEVYSMNLMSAMATTKETKTKADWLLSIGPFLRTCVCGPACSRHDLKPHSR